MTLEMREHEKCLRQAESAQCPDTGWKAIFYMLAAIYELLKERLPARD